jgi:hypothetical protein
MKIEFAVTAPEEGTDERDRWEALKTQINILIESDLEGVTCTDHNKPPQQVTVKGSLKDFEYIVEGCCQKFIDEVTQMLED